MKRMLVLVALAIAELLPCALTAQAVRFTSNAYTINSSSPQPGALYPVLAAPGAAVTICAYSATSPCPSVVTTYTDATEATSCPTTAQLTPSNSAACTGNADLQGGFGAWLQAGTYQYNVTTAYGTYGPYAFTVGGGGSSGTTYVQAGTGISVTGNGTSSTPYIISTQTAFSINSFTGCTGTVELGTSIVNPSFAASYSTTPASAVITNTEGIGSPLNLTSPFTNGTVSGTFVHTAIETTVFTLTATQGTSQTKTCSDSWQPAIFGGIGATGATSSVTASGTTAVLSTGNALARIQFGAETVGQTFGPYFPSGQNIYLLLTGGSHTFVDACTGFPFAMNSPISVSFVNAQGASVPMYLYGSTNPLYSGGCGYEPKIAS